MSLTPRLDMLSVLIVDDNQYMRSLVRALFSAFGIVQIRDCENVEQAMRAMYLSPADIVLTDLMMQPQDGLVLTKQLRANSSPSPMVPIIMMSGCSERSHVEAARDAGVTEFVTKPITSRALFDRLVAAIDSPRAFVQCDTFFGPDRRRRKSPNYKGPLRRNSDQPGFTDRSALEL